MSVAIEKEDGFALDDAHDRLDLGVIHRFLADSYWARGIPRDVVAEAIAGSWSFGLYAPAGDQAGFARLVTDRATFAYLADVFVLEAYRGRGLGKWMVAAIMALPELKGMRRILLATFDAHSLYAREGFGPLARPERMMEISRPDIYAAAAGAHS